MPMDGEIEGKVVAPVENPLGPDVVQGEIVDGMPGKNELILLGRTALAERGVDPDDLTDARTEAQLRRGMPENTRDAMRWGYGFLVKYCGLTGRRHDPPTVGTIRKMISDAYHMTAADGRGRGRYGQPYAPATIELVVYTCSMVFDRLQWINPCRHPLVADQLAGYREDYVSAGYRTDESDELSHAQSVILGRSQDLGTVQGLRNAAMLRGQFDLGCRADEWCKVQGQDVVWIDEETVQVTFTRTKGRKPRTVTMEALPTVDWDVDPVRLLLAYWRARQSAGWDGTGPLWVQVHRGDRRKDFEETGVLGGRFLTAAMVYDAYAAVFDRAVRKTGIDIDVVTKRRTRHYTTHSNRIGLIDTAFKAGLRREWIEARTGHAPGSKVFDRYLRLAGMSGDNNAGLVVRRAAAGGGGNGRQD